MCVCVYFCVCLTCVCVCVFVCNHIYSICVYVCVCVRAWVCLIYMCVCMFLFLCVSACTYLHALECVCVSPPAHLLHQVPEEDGLLPQWVVDQALREEDHPVGEVVLRQPGDHALLLHVRTARDVDDEVAQLLPVSGEDRIRRRRGGGQEGRRRSRR